MPDAVIMICKEGACMAKLFQVLRRLVIFIRVWVGILVGKDVGLRFLDRRLRHVRRQTWGQVGSGRPRDRFSRYRAHVGLLIWKANLSRAGFVPLDGCIMRKGRPDGSADPAAIGSIIEFGYERSVQVTCPVAASRVF